MKLTKNSVNYFQNEIALGSYGGKLERLCQSHGTYKRIFLNTMCFGYEYERGEGMMSKCH